jgi:hypothetical protein
MTDIVERLAGYCTDYDGSPIPDGADPMDGLHCDVLYAAMNEILSLRSRAEKAEAELLTMTKRFNGAVGLKDQQRMRAEAAEATCEKLAAALDAIATYPKEGQPRRTEDGYPAELAYDEFAYKRMVDTYRACANDVLSLANLAEKPKRENEREDDHAER